jgi:predicted nuclease of predicted toxin-antitoxin system
MRETDDDVIWEYAKEHGFIVVTKDSDFRDLSEKLGHPPKVILITLGNVPTAEVESLLRQRHADVISFQHDAGRGFLALP